VLGLSRSNRCKASGESGIERLRIPMSDGRLLMAHIGFSPFSLPFPSHSGDDDLCQESPANPVPR
jgi:hypothetical protein